MMKVRKAVIAAGGWSTRFLPAVKAYAKHLVPILAKPNIQYLVEELMAAGVKQIAIVHRPHELSIKRHFAPDAELEKYLKKTDKEPLLAGLKLIQKKVNFHFMPQSSRLPYGNASPILRAKAFLGQEPFVYMYGDDLVLEKKSGNYLCHLIKLFEKYQSAIVAGAEKVPLERISSLSSVKYRQDKNYLHRIETVVEKPASGQAFSNVALFGRFVISAEIFPVLKKQKTSRGELWLTEAVNTLAKKDVAIAEPIPQGEWVTTGDPLNWLKANLKFGLKDNEIGKELKKFLKEIIKG